VVYGGWMSGIRGMDDWYEVDGCVVYDGRMTGV